MKVTRYSSVNSEPVTVEIDVSERQMKDYQSGFNLDVVADHLTEPERQFIRFGVLDDSLKTDPSPKQVRDRVLSETPTQYFPDSL